VVQPYFLYIYVPFPPFDYFTLDELEDAEETEEEEIPNIVEVKKSEPAPIESLTGFNDATPNTRLNYLHIGTPQHMEKLMKPPFEFSLFISFQ
jgi:hypothetical protein